MEINRFKYPRTPHLPWSSGNSDDDIMLLNTKHFEGKEVVVTEKLDGENTTMYIDYIHARSINNRPHASREWVKKIHATISYLIPYGWRLCGENVYARHSIAYDHLESYFYLFSIWNDENICLDWSQTVEWAELLGLKTPKKFYCGVWNEKLISHTPIDTTHSEGYVVRTTESFPYDAFKHHVAKWVRKNHVTTSEEYWMNKEVIPNLLAKDNL
jgi:hypothetical protein